MPASSASRIFEACREGNHELASLLVQENSDVIEEIDGNNERIPLHEACLHGHLELARLVRCHDLKADFDKNLPIHYACKSGNAALVQFLCSGPNEQVKMSLKSRNRFGQLPLHLAAAGGFADIVDTLLLHDDGRFNGLRVTDRNGLLPMHHACRSGNITTVQRILRGLKSGAFQMRDKDGWFPLHHACSSENCTLALIEFLVHENPNALDVRTATSADADLDKLLPLEIALARGQSQPVIEFLSRAGGAADTSKNKNHEDDAGFIDDEEADDVGLLKKGPKEERQENVEECDSQGTTRLLDGDLNRHDVWMKWTVFAGCLIGNDWARRAGCKCLPHYHGAQNVADKEHHFHHRHHLVNNKSIQVAIVLMFLCFIFLWINGSWTM